jgi:hypothetical protein
VGAGEASAATPGLPGVLAGAGSWLVGWLVLLDGLGAVVATRDLGGIKWTV